MRWLYVILMAFIMYSTSLCPSVSGDNIRITRAVDNSDNYLDIAWHPSGDYALIAGYRQDNAALFRYAHSKVSLIETFDEEEVRGVDWAPDGSYALAVGTGDLVVRYEDGEATVINSGASHYNYFNAVAFSPLVNEAVIVGQNLARYSEEGLEDIFEPYLNVAMDAAWAPDGSYCLIVGRDGEIFEYDGGKYLKQLVWESDEFPSHRSISFRGSGNEALLVAGSFVRYKDGNLTRMADVDELLMSVAWKPDGEYALAVSQDGTIYRYDGTSVEALHREEYYNNLMGIEWHPSGSYAVIVGSGTIFECSSGSGNSGWAEWGSATMILILIALITGIAILVVVNGVMKGRRSERDP